MKGDYLAVFITGILLGASIGTALMLNKYRDGVWVPCSIAEISPDVPPKLKDWCRSQNKLGTKI